MCVCVCACVYARAIGCGQTGAGEKKRDLNESEFFRSETDSRNPICRNPNLNRALRQRKGKKLSGSSSGVQFLGNSVASTSSHFFLAWPSRALFFGARTRTKHPTETWVSFKSSSEDSRFGHSIDESQQRSISGFESFILISFGGTIFQKDVDRFDEESN